MTRRRLVLKAMLGITLLPLAGCGGGADGGTGQGGILALGGQRQSSAAAQGGYSVLLKVFRGPNHMAEAKLYRDRLSSVRGWDGLVVMHQADHSELYWGRFRTPEDARPSLQRAKDYRAQNGAVVFEMPLVVPLPGEQIGPPEWALKNNPETYSLLVAVYVNDAEAGYHGCQADAVKAVEALRAAGEQAWYYHEPGRSSVTIGSFGPRAVQYYMTRLPTPPDAPASFEAPEVRRARIVDPQLQALQRKYPLLAVNGRRSQTVTRDAQGNEHRTDDESYVIEVASAKR